MTEFQKQAAAALRDQLTVMGQRDIPTNRDGFDDEFDSLRNLDHRTRQNHDEFYTSLLGSNASKNRYADVLPNEATRVVLDPINTRGDGDYINANYIDGRRLFGVPFVYIATQAPLRSTVGDFWRMVFENNTAFVVMLCAEIEAGKQKSERYWPDGQGGVLSLGPLSLVLLSENHRADTIFRTILIRTLDGKERKVFHMQYVRWPDQGIPQSSTPLMEIIVALGRSPLSTQTPIVVHCSGGVGRTGVFITLHIALALFQLEKPISVPQIVQYLKLCRTGMVQRKDQYLFCYYAVLREMERMVWAFEHSTEVESRLNSSGMSSRNVPLPRRPSEHVPQHVAQHVGDIPRTPVVSFGSARAQQRPEHGIQPARTVPTRGAPQSNADEEFGPSLQSTWFDPAAAEHESAQSGGPSNALEDQLRQLQMKSKSMRSSYGGFARSSTMSTAKPSFTAGGGGIYNSNYSTNQPQYQPAGNTNSSNMYQGPRGGGERPSQSGVSARLILEEPRREPTPQPQPVANAFQDSGSSQQQGLPPLSTVPQLNLTSGAGRYSSNTGEAGDYAKGPASQPARPTSPQPKSSEEPPRSTTMPPAQQLPPSVVNRGDSLFFSPEPNRPPFTIPTSSLQTQPPVQNNNISAARDPSSDQLSGVAANEARPSDLSAAAKEFNSALFAPMNQQQSFTTATTSSSRAPIRKTDIGLL